MCLLGMCMAGNNYHGGGKAGWGLSMMVVLVVVGGLSLYKIPAMPPPSDMPALLIEWQWSVYGKGAG